MFNNLLCLLFFHKNHTGLMNSVLWITKWTSFTAKRLTCHSRKSMVINTNMMTELNPAASVSGSWYCACCVTVKLSWLTGYLNRTEPLIMLLVTAVCLLQTMTSQNVCCEKIFLATIHSQTVEVGLSPLLMNALKIMFQSKLTW